MTSPQQHNRAADHSIVSIQDGGQTLSGGFLVDRCDFWSFEALGSIFNPVETLIFQLIFQEENKT